MTLNNLAKLLILLPVGACVTEDIGDEAQPAQFSDDVVADDTGTEDGLSPVLAVPTVKTPPGLPPPVQPPTPPTPDGTPAPAADVDMVWNGTSWFAVWTDWRNDHADIRGAMVGADGEVQPPAGILLIGGAGDQFRPRVAWNNGRYLVVYTDSAAGYFAVRGARVDAGGTVLDAGGFRIGMPLELGYSPEVASNGTSFYAVWYGDCGVVGCTGNVRGQFISSSGNVGPAVTLKAQAATPAIAFDGNRYLAVYTDLSGDGDIGARYIHADGTPSSSMVLVRDGMQGAPTVAAGAGKFMIAWNEDGAVMAARLKDGVAIDQPALLARNAIDAPALAGSDTGFALCWTQLADTEVQVRGMAIDLHGKQASAWISIRLPLADDDRLDSKRPAVSFAGNGEYAMVTWQDVADTGATTIWARPTLQQDPFLVSALPE